MPKNALGGRRILRSAERNRPVMAHVSNSADARARIGGSMKSIFHWAWLAAHIVAFTAFAHFSFARNYGLLSYGGDGAIALAHAMYQWIWTPTALGMHSSPFQGMNDLWWGTNINLIPGYFLPMLLLGNAGVISSQYIISSYMMFSIEMFLAALVLSRALGMNWLLSIISAWTLPLLAQPFFGYSLLYPIVMLSPSFGTMISNFAFLVAAISYLGRGQGSLAQVIWRNLFPVCAILVLLIVMVASNPLLSLLWIPALPIISLGLILGATGRERLLKFAGLVLISLVLMASGIFFFLLGMFRFSVPYFMPQDLENALTSTYLVSIWYGDPGTGPMGPKLVGAGLSGMALALAFGDRRWRWLALSVSIYLAAILSAGHAALKWEFWRGPASIYFEFPIWPLYVIFAVWGMGWLGRLGETSPQLAQRLDRRESFERRATDMPAPSGRAAKLADLWSLVSPMAGQWARSRRWVIVRLLILLVIPVFAFWQAWAVNNPKRLAPVPPSKPPMIAVLQEQVGLTVGAPFRGRVVTMEFLNKKEPIGWVDFITKDWPRYVATGNDYHGSGLWFHAIPTLFQSTSSIAPDFFRAVTRLLARPNDRQSRGAIILRRPQAQVLAAFGVRFVITDAELDVPFQLIIKEHTYDNETMFLYEVPDVNLGNYSPTAVKLVRTFDDAVDKLAEPNFDLKHLALVFDSGLVTQHLNPVDVVQVRMVRGGYFVEAHSPGTSLLVLPFEFSRCLRIEVNNTANAPRLFRVNAIETGVLFNGHLAAKIEYFTGLFRNSACRLRDTQDFMRLLVTN